MAAPEILEHEEISHTGHGGGWLVTVFNNDANTYDEVMHILIVATGCDEEEAFIETWEIDHLGQSVVHQASQEECEGVALVISGIGIETKVSEA